MNIVTNDKLLKFMNRLSIKISDSGYALLDDSWNQQSVCSPFSRLYYIAGGEGYVSCSGRKLQLLPGNCYLLPAGLRIDYHCSCYLEKLYFHVNLSFPNGLDIFRHTEEPLRLPVNSRKTHRLLQLYKKNQLPDALELQTLLTMDLIRFLRLLPEEMLWEKRYSQPLCTVFHLAQDPVSAATTVHSLADALNISESSLNRKFRREMGISPGAYLDQLLLRESSRLLLETDLTISEIAEQLQFGDQFYFSRYFRQHLGEPPSWYRKRLKSIP